jgi:hypothetical protein
VRVLQRRRFSDLGRRKCRTVFTQAVTRTPSRLCLAPLMRKFSLAQGNVPKGGSKRGMCATACSLAWYSPQTCVRLNCTFITLFRVREATIDRAAYLHVQSIFTMLVVVKLPSHGLKLSGTEDPDARTAPPSPRAGFHLTHLR